METKTMEWKKINDYDNYSVSNEGQIRNDKTGRILKQYGARGGYAQVTLSKDGKTKTKYVHRLVMETFKPNDNPQKFTDINHIDYNKSNNSLDNLEWCTHAENMKWGTAPVNLNYIAEEIKDMVVLILNKYFTNFPDYTDKLGEKIKNASINSMIYQTR